MARSIMSSSTVLTTKSRNYADGGKYPLSHKTVSFHPFRKFPLCGRLNYVSNKRKRKRSKKEQQGEKNCISHGQIKA